VTATRVGSLGEAPAALVETIRLPGGGLQDVVVLVFIESLADAP
jgi:hypothetical protein